MENTFTFDWSDLVTGVLLLTAAKVFNDLIPTRKIFTPKGVLIALALMLAGWSVWQLIRVSISDEPISSTIAQTFLVSMGTTCTIAAYYGYLIFHLLRRMAAIEAHCGPSKPPRKPLSL